MVGRTRVRRTLAAGSLALIALAATAGCSGTNDGAATTDANTSPLDAGDAFHGAVVDVRRDPG
jgi:hypothetical protein